MSTTVVVDTLGIIGTIFAVGLFASQVPFMRKIAVEGVY